MGGTHAQEAEEGTTTSLAVLVHLGPPPLSNPFPKTLVFSLHIKHQGEPENSSVPAGSQHRA